MNNDSNQTIKIMDFYMDKIERYLKETREEMQRGKKRTYEFDMDCDNCGGARINIPYGITIDDFKAKYNQICPSCGCPMKEK